MSDEEESILDWVYNYLVLRFTSGNEIPVRSIHLSVESLPDSIIKKIEEKYE